MTASVSTARAAEDFLVDYVARHGDEREEVRAADCFRAAEDAGFSRDAIRKARHRNDHRIGTRLTSRRDGDDVSGDTHWFPRFDPSLLGDSTAVECAKRVADELAAQVAEVLPLLNAEQRDRLIGLLRPVRKAAIG
ncbi:hypothetical protein [Mycobacteroides abscessus]|uniref:hypothetical protein n=1 Tax=Mycobacteroides abscessus TaxID=36809 RepID=UPI0019D10D97|nr:hypothetical protein [Mycobacteroides abscessus]MBN7411171.1 hypothetical protein [Mycobacteroides abscessus subsp. abscessus]